MGAALRLLGVPIDAPMSSILPPAEAAEVEEET